MGVAAKSDQASQKALLLGCPEQSLAYKANTGSEQKDAVELREYHGVQERERGADLERFGCSCWSDGGGLCYPTLSQKARKDGARKDRAGPAPLTPPIPLH